MKRTHRTPRLENPGDGGRGASRRRAHTGMADRTKAGWMAYAERLEAALRPFADAVYDDNGDITVSTDHIDHGDWLCAFRALRKEK